MTQSYFVTVCGEEMKTSEPRHRLCFICIINTFHYSEARVSTQKSVTITMHVLRISKQQITNENKILKINAHGIWKAIKLLNLKHKKVLRLLQYHKSHLLISLLLLLSRRHQQVTKDNPVHLSPAFLVLNLINSADCEAYYHMRSTVM